MIVAKLAVVVATVVGMEAFAWAVHKYVMHSDWGWGWHESHHSHTTGLFERNDLYAAVFSAMSAALFIGGALGVWWMWYMGLGLVVYGLLYTFVHDGMVHGRLPMRWTPKSGYLHRLVLAHRMHHHITDKDDGVAFGFLYAENPDKLKATLKARRKRRQLAKVQADGRA